MGITTSIDASNLDALINWQPSHIEMVLRKAKAVHAEHQAKKAIRGGGRRGSVVRADAAAAAQALEEADDVDETANTEDGEASPKPAVTNEEAAEAQERRVRIAEDILTGHAHDIRLTMVEFYQKQGFLHLPWEYYAIFKDTPEATTVSGQEVMLLMVLFSNMSQEEQARMCFTLFDMDDSGGMTRDEMFAFLTCVSRAACRSGVVTRVPSDAEIMKIAQSVFALADADGSGDIGVPEFVEWSQTHTNTKRLLRAFEQVRVESKGVEIEEAEKQDEPVDGATVATLGAVRLNREDNKKQAISNAALEAIKSQTAFDANELRRLRQHFQDALGSQRKAELTRAQFSEVMQNAYPNLVQDGEANMFDLLFDSFDTDMSGSIDFQEFSIGMSKLIKGSTQDKLELLFEVYDADKSGAVSTSELISFVSRSNTEFSEARAKTQAVVSKMDITGSGKVSQEAFASALRKDPSLFGMFAEAGAPDLKTVEVDFQNMQLRHPELTIPKLHSLWTDTVANLGATHARAAICHFTDLKNFFSKHFGVQEVALLSRFYQLYTGPKGESPRWQSLLCGLGQMLKAMADDRAAFCFALYDMDGSGEMDTEELMALLLSGNRQTEDGLAKIHSVLQKLDKDGDGTVTLEEFKAATMNDPELLATLNQMMGVEQVMGMSDEQRAFAKIQRLLKAASKPVPVCANRRELLAELGRRRACVHKGLIKFRHLRPEAKTELIRNLQITDARTVGLKESKDPSAASYTQRPSSVLAREYGRHIRDVLATECREIKLNKVVQAETIRQVIGKLQADDAPPMPGGKKPRSRPASAQPVRLSSGAGSQSVPILSRRSSAPTERPTAKHAASHAQLRPLSAKPMTSTAFRIVPGTGLVEDELAPLASIHPGVHSHAHDSPPGEVASGWSVLSHAPMPVYVPPTLEEKTPRKDFVPSPRARASGVPIPRPSSALPRQTYVPPQGSAISASRAARQQRPWSAKELRKDRPPSPSAASRWGWQ